MQQRDTSVASAGRGPLFMYLPLLSYVMQNGRITRIEMRAASCESSKLECAATGPTSACAQEQDARDGTGAILPCGRLSDAATSRLPSAFSTSLHRARRLIMERWYPFFSLLSISESSSSSKPSLRDAGSAVECSRNLEDRRSLHNGPRLICWGGPATVAEPHLFRRPSEVF